jgi:hypothetical protein
MNINSISRTIVRLIPLRYAFTYRTQFVEIRGVRRKAAMAQDNLFKPGEKVPDSGIYKIVHDRNHRVDHEVTCIANERFPPCHGCGKGVRFRLFMKALHFSELEEFRIKAA